MLVGIAALLAFGVLSLVVTSTELNALDLATEKLGRGKGRETTHSQVVAEWQGEANRDRLVARGNVQQPGLNVGRVLAKYDKEEKDSEKENGNMDPGIPALVEKSPEAVPKHEGEDGLLYEKYLALQLNWTSRLISSSSHYDEVREKLKTLGVLKNRELRMDSAARELWLYLRDQLQTINTNKESPSEADDTKTKLLHSIKEQLDLLSLHLSDTQKAVNSFIKPGWRDTMATEMTKLIQKRLHYLQNPDDCDKAKKLLCRISKPCGFGCQIHHVAFCFIFAYATERMLVLDSSGWRYSGKWEAVFQPLSTSGCTISNSGSRSWHTYTEANPPEVIQVPSIESLGHGRPSFLPMAVPADLIDRLNTFHGYPFVWFVGQFLQYLMRPSQQLEEYLEDRRKALNITHPIVGLHIRRTDKLQQEASYHSAQEYMTQVEEWYQRRETISGRKEQRTVYLATDDKSALTEARNLYPNYRFVSDNDVSRTAGELSSRYSEKGLFGVVLDVFMLSKCDFIVCTLSSQVCRLAYELMQVHHTDASRLVYSLDDVYYFGGQQEHVLRAFHGKTENGGGAMDFAKRDLIKIAGNHLNGFSLGSRQNGGRQDLFPSYKVEEEIRVANFPTYPDVL